MAHRAAGLMAQERHEGGIALLLAVGAVVALVPRSRAGAAQSPAVSCQRRWHIGELPHSPDCQNVMDQLTRAESLALLAPPTCPSPGNGCARRLLPSTSAATVELNETAAPPASPTPKNSSSAKGRRTEQTGMSSDRVTSTATDLRPHAATGEIASATLGVYVRHRSEI
jgi:hypothetical protein